MWKTPCQVSGVLPFTSAFSEHSRVKVTPILTLPDHHNAPAVAVLAARGCTWMTLAGQARGKRWRQVTNGRVVGKKRGGFSERKTGWWRTWHKVTPRWLLTPCDGFQLLLLRPFHVYDICTCLAPLTGGVTPLRHFSQNSCCLSDFPLRTQMHLAQSAANSQLHMLAKECRWEYMCMWNTVFTC